MNNRCRGIAGQHLLKYISHWCATQHFCEKQLFDDCRLDFSQGGEHEKQFSKPRGLTGVLVSNVLFQRTLGGILKELDLLGLCNRWAVCRDRFLNLVLNITRIIHLTSYWFVKGFPAKMFKKLMLWVNIPTPFQIFRMERKKVSQYKFSIIVTFRHSRKICHDKKRFSWID